MTLFRSARLLAALPLLGLALIGCQDGAGIEAAPATLETTEALDVLPPAQFVGMVDFAAARRSDAVGPMLDGPASPFGGAAAELDEVERLTGFDPATDLDRVYVAGSPGAESGAFVAFARFDRERMERFIAAQDDAGLARTDVDGVPAWTVAEDGRAFMVALPSERMMMAGSEAAVRAMLARLADGSKGLSADAALMGLVRKAGQAGAWMVMQDIDDEFGGPDPTGQVGAVADDVVMSFGFEDTGLAFDAFLVPRDGAAASDVADLTRGAVSAMRVEAASQPELMTMLDGVRVDAEGDGVRVTGLAPASFLSQR